MNDSSDRTGVGNDGEESFAALLDQYSPEKDTELRVGDKIEGRIVSITGDTVFVDTRTKMDAGVDKSELTDENGEMPYSVGDTVALYVVAATESEVRLSRAIAGAGGLDLLKEARDQQIPVEGLVRATCKGGFHVDVAQRRAFCPISQIDRTYVEDPELYVGEKLQFLISRIEAGGRNIVVSRRRLLEREAAESRREFLKTLCVDQILEGRVTRIQPFGAFVELAPGVEGLVHVSELSWSRSAGAQDAVRAGERITVKVLGIEQAGESGKTKISLSAKQVGTDPWLEIEQKFHIGQKIDGTVTRCAKFGAFVEIAPGIEGLVHVSELSFTRRISDPSEVAAEGDSVAVVIKDIDPGKRRLALSIRDAEGDPWTGVDERFAVGQTVEGRLEKREPFGCFVNLAPGITGLLPQSSIARSSASGRIQKAREGEAVTVVIESIKADERKMTLAPGDPESERDWRRFSASSPTGLGSLGEKLQQALSGEKK